MSRNVQTLSDLSFSNLSNYYSNNYSVQYEKEDIYDDEIAKNSKEHTLFKPFLAFLEERDSEKQTDTS